MAHGSNIVKGTLEISINVPSIISPKLPSNVHEKLIDFSTELSVPFFTTSHNENVLSPEQLALAEDSLNKWIDGHFATCFLPGYSKELTNHTLSFLTPMGLPELGVPGSKVFRQMAELFTFAFLVDDMMDRDQEEFLLEEYRIPAQEFYQVWEVVGKVLNAFGVSDGGVMQRSRTSPPSTRGKVTFALLRLTFPLLKGGIRNWKRCWNLVKRLLNIFGANEAKKTLMDHEHLILHPFVYRLFVSSMDFISGSWISSADTIQFMFSIIPMNSANRWVNQHMGTKRDVDINFSEETYRFMRSEDSGLLLMVDSFYIRNYGYLPRWIYHSPQLRHLQTLATCLFASLNDLNGFGKDLAEGELGSVVVFQLLNGKDPGDVLKMETEKFGAWVKDYLWFRQDLLLSHGDAVAKYIDIVDSIVTGCLRSYISAVRYGMGKARILFVPVVP